MKKNLEPLKDALEELADFARKMEPTEYAYFYRLMERMENNVEICILVRDDRLEKLEAILRRDWNLVKRMYGDMWKMDLQNEKERYRFLQLLTEIEWKKKGMVMRIERAADATERVVICRTFCVLRLKNEFGMINSRNTGAKEILWTERFMIIM